MENQYVPYLYPAHSTLPVSLFGLVSRLQTSLLPEASHQKSLVINDVDKSVAINTDEDMLAYVVGGLMSIAIYSTSDACIRIETSRHDSGVHLFIRSNGDVLYTLPLVTAA